MIYLDHNATTPPSPSVKAFIQGDMVNYWANPSSEYILGNFLADEIKKSRSLLADFLGVSTKGLIFTSGATESINTVLSIDNLKAHGISKILSSPLEHHATLDRLKYLAKNGIDVVWIPNNEQGSLDLNFIENNVRPDTLVSILYANNEIGTIHPIGEIAALTHQLSGYIHIDAVQALGKIKFDLDQLDVDFASFSGHKIGALKGVGAIYVKDIKSFPPLLHGGGQERGFRPGTLNAAAIKSFGLAIGDVCFQKMSQVEELRNYFESEILKNSKVQINGIDTLRLPNTSNIYLGGRSSREVLMELSRKEIYVSTGSACSAGSFEPSHVIKGLGFNSERGLGSLRISLSSSVDKKEIEKLILEINALI
jgi:cysteine desulfurase